MVSMAVAFDFEKMKEDAFIADVEARKIEATRPKTGADEIIYQLKQLRIETAYPNDPAMWRALNRTSEANRKRYLGE